jgi:DNA-binding transcriptional LysR family regulator
MSITHRHIEVFRAVMTTGSVTSAAAMLFTSQPTISRELAQLELLLGFPLFDRIRGRLRPTARTLTLFEEVQRTYIGLDRILATAASLKACEQGQLSVICMPSLSHSPLPAVCRRFLAEHPGVAISITPQESPLLEEWLTAQRHDIGLTERSAPPPGTNLEPLLVADEVCVLPAGHPLLARKVLRPEDFAGERFVSLAPTDAYRKQIDEICRQHGVLRNLVVETHSAVSVCAMVQAGIGLALVNPFTAQAFAGKGLEMRRFSISIPFHVNIVRPEHRPSSPITDQFVTTLKAEAQDLLAALPR